LAKPKKSLILQIRKPKGGEVTWLVLSHVCFNEASTGQLVVVLFPTSFHSPTLMWKCLFRKRACHPIIGDRQTKWKKIIMKRCLVKWYQSKGKELKICKQLNTNLIDPSSFVPTERWPFQGPAHICS
jgi:hypothetical protein